MVLIKRPDDEKGTPELDIKTTTPVRFISPLGQGTGIGNVSTLVDYSNLADFTIGSTGTLINRAFGIGMTPIEREIAQLRQRVAEQSEEIDRKDAASLENVEKISTLQKTIAELDERMALHHLLERIHPDAAKLARTSKQFLEQFRSDVPVSAYIVSVDIRRSTELMLKARSAEGFATFITSLCADLSTIIKASWGVFDKFTGDGVLAIFPTFYSGEDAGYFALDTAGRCHAAFAEHYRLSRGNFTSVLMDTGLGIGVDFGQVQLVQVSGGLTAVGAPVVYACRMAAAPAGTTYVNEPAYGELTKRYGGHFSFAERTLDLKHEGRTLAYEASRMARTYTPAIPSWTSGQGAQGSTNF